MFEILTSFQDKPLTLPAAPASFIKVAIQDENSKNFDSRIHLQSKTTLPLSNSEVLQSGLKKPRKLAGGEDIKTVYEVFLDVGTSNYDFLPGDTIAIITQNTDEDVLLILERLELIAEADKPCRIKLDENTTKKNSKIPLFIPPVGTVRKLLSEVLDVRNIPKKIFLRALSEHTTVPDEKHLLEILCSREGSSFYTDLVVRSGFSFVDLLRSFKSCKPPINLLLEHLTRLMPRPYSIANSPLVDKTRIRIVFSIDDQKKGLTTSLMERIIMTGYGSVFFYFRQRTDFKLSNDDALNRNHILVSAGTGIAPFLGFLEHKQALDSKSTSWLFNGCRYKRNYLYHSEIQGHLQNNVVEKIFDAISRDSNKQHIQDLILSNQNDLLQFLSNEKTVMYLCGSQEMLEELEKIIIEILASKNDSLEESKAVLVEWKANKKYVEDVWH